MDNEYEDLKWKAEYLQSRGYYVTMSLIQLIEMLKAHGEKPYPWKHDFANTIINKVENVVLEKTPDDDEEGPLIT